MGKKLIFVSLLFLFGCANNNSLLKENNILKKEIANLKSDLKEQKQEIKFLKDELQFKESEISYWGHKYDSVVEVIKTKRK